MKLKDLGPQLGLSTWKQPAKGQWGSLRPIHQGRIDAGIEQDIKAAPGRMPAGPFHKVGTV
ncbi:MAG: hypothetical protein EBT13_16195 [Rhodobacteraceae bacterium]|nr:hypothetical protein [Paracoccaceae bacterium]